MRLVFTAVALLITGSVTAQIFIGSAGNSASSTSGYIVYSVGQMVIDTYDVSSNSFTYGFNQPIPGTIGVLENTSREISVFPNPTVSTIQVEARRGSTISIYDVSGKEVYIASMSEDKVTCDLSALISGNYTMMVRHTTNITTIKLIKI